jgi:hypothetical protein
MTISKKTGISELPNFLVWKDREKTLMPKPYTKKPPTKEDSETLIFASWREVLEGYYFSNKKPTEKVS